jgi:Xaa-Pro aminopeptidase
VNSQTPKQHGLLPEFPSEEFDRRLDALHRSLANHAIDGLLVVDEVNYRYITGHYTEAWKNPSRRRACWVGQEASPVLIVPPGEAADVYTLSPWPDVFEYGGPTAGPLRVNGDLLLGFEPGFVSGVVDTGRQLGLERASAIGLAVGGWSKLDVPFGVIDSVRTHFDANWVDAAPALWETRMVKSDLEIDYMRASVRALDAAYARTFAEIDAGMTEQAVTRTMRANILLAGAEHDGYTIAVADVQKSRGFGSPPTDRAIRPGALVMIDAGAVIHGYTSDYSRMAILGDPTQRQSEAYDLLLSAHRAGIDAVRPGVTAGDITRLMQRVLEEDGAKLSPEGRMGHGTGLEVPEPPSFHLAAETVLVEGMILCVEPNTPMEGAGAMVAEDVVVVRADGAEHLSTAPTPAELIRI